LENGSPERPWFNYKTINWYDITAFICFVSEWFDEDFRGYESSPEAMSP
jgi:hypothetical protein